MSSQLVDLGSIQRMHQSDAINQEKANSLSCLSSFRYSVAFQRQISIADIQSHQVSASPYAIRPKAAIPCNLI